MSWRYWLTDWNIFIKEDIDALNERQRVARKHARRRARQTDERLDDLEDAVGELRLVTGALMATLLEAGIVDPDKFRANVERIDLEDGVADGKATLPPKERPKPKAPSRSKRHT